MAKRDRGTGSLFTPKGSTVIWCQYYIHGQRQRESTHETNKLKATKYLNTRLQEVSAGTRTVDMDKVTVDMIMENKFITQKIKGNKSIADDKLRWELYLKPFFGGMKASAITTRLIKRYIAIRQETEMVKRQKTKAGVKLVRSGKTPSNGTLNRELALLRGAMHVAMEEDKVLTTVPYFPMRSEAKPRQGYLKDTEYTRVAEECAKVGAWMRCLFEVHYTFGWRRDEVLTLQVSQVNLADREISLDPSRTKNGDTRSVPMTQRVYELISVLIAGKKPTDYVFTREDGSPVLDYRRTWQNICAAAGIKLLIHDLRRTAARNMRRLNIADATIMRMGGWKTRSMFDRYNIIDQNDMEEAMEQLDARQETLAKVQSQSAPETQQQAQSAGMVN